jgi:hypothetical protein
MPVDPPRTPDVVPPVPNLRLKKVSIYLSQFEERRIIHLAHGKKLDMPVAGFRGWTDYQDGTLSPINPRLSKGFRWSVDSVNYARCIVSPGRLCADCVHFKAGVCECGLYCFHDAVPENAYTGIVVGWGTVIQHQFQGWRSTQAKIMAMVYSNVEQLRLFQRLFPQMMMVAEEDAMDVAEQFGILLIRRKG